MDLSYPQAIQESLNRIGQVLGEVSLRDEFDAVLEPAALWQTKPSRNGHATPAVSPLAQVVEFRALGAYALPLTDLLARIGRSYLPLPKTGAAVSLGSPDVSAPLDRGQAFTAQLKGGRLSGTIQVAPFCIPAAGVVLLAQGDYELVLVEAVAEAGRVERVGEAFAVQFEDASAQVLARGAEAEQAWERAVQWERLALIGLTAGLIDRAWRIALDALCEGKRVGHELADEQVAQFQLADNDIERLSAEHLVLDAAIDADGQRPHAGDKLALVRYYTSGQAERCAARALHVAQLFTPRLVPIARWLVQRAHHLSVFGMAREHEVRTAVSGLAAGMSLG